MQGDNFDLEWLAPLNEEGNLPFDSFENVVGQHTGMYAALNVTNPQPGYEYSHAHNTPQGVLLARMRGGQVVQSGDPERSFTPAEGQDLSATPLDSANSFGDVILIRTPEERRRRELEEHERRSNERLRNAGRDFIDGASAAEQQYGGRRPTRLLGDDHMLTFEDAQGRPVDQWRPDQGIVRNSKADL